MLCEEDYKIYYDTWVEPSSDWGVADTDLLVKLDVHSKTFSDWEWCDSFSSTELEMDPNSTSSLDPD